MKRMTLTELQARTLEILLEVHRARVPVVVMHDGRPLARVEPADEEESWLGKLSGTMIITGDIVAPVAEDDWEANR